VFQGGGSRRGAGFLLLFQRLGCRYKGLRVRGSRARDWNAIRDRDANRETPESGILENSEGRCGLYTPGGTHLGLGFRFRTNRGQLERF